MAKLSKKEKRDRKAVRRLNACVDWSSAVKALNDKDCKVLIGLFGDGVVHVGKTGFSLANGIECQPREKDFRRAYPDGQSPYTALLTAEQVAEGLRRKIEKFKAEVNDPLLSGGAMEIRNIRTMVNDIFG